MSQRLFLPELSDPSGPTAGARKAALLLHAMAPEDQRWMLNQLPESEQQELLSLQVELEELKIPADQVLLKEVISTLGHQGSAACPAQEGCEPVSTIEILKARVRGLDPEALAHVLKEEPIKLLVRLLELEQWQWTARVLEQFDEATRLRVLRGLAKDGGTRATGTGHRVSDQIILEGVLARVQARLTSKRSVGSPRPIWEGGWRALVGILSASTSWVSKMARSGRPSHRREGRP